MHQSKELLRRKEIVTRLKGQQREREKIFASYSSDKGLYSRTYKDLNKLNP
jgi:hypothetical protein